MQDKTTKKPTSKKAPTKKASKSKKVMDEPFEEKIITKPMEQVMHDSMMPYSEYVIMDRALPRVEDGLKPVQRRVLYSMLEVGVLPDRPFRKSARIVGDCMGKYHPHGDRSIYDTMVRMAQEFNMGEVLVSGHGNFGSVDGDTAAAMRYTEAKLAPIALELLRDLEKNTVTWSYNFDDSCKEPDMLPGRFPNLLVNGGTGIAVGLATNIPTHNLTEVCNAVCAYIDNKNITLDELLKIMPGPDFPTGAYILDTSEVQKVYETGRGRIFLRSKLHIENAGNGRKNIVITEIPYQVNKSNLLRRIATLKDAETNGGPLSYITEIIDESDRNGMRAIIRLRRDARVGSILATLFKYTDLQTTFNVNMVAIADGRPKQLGLIEIIDYYVNYQQKIIYNRTKYDLEMCLKREHVLEGLLIAINNIDKVIKIIRQSRNITDARITLMQTFNLSEIQAQAILDMRLARLTNLEVDRLEVELKRLKELIKRYTAILKSPSLQMKIVKQELGEIVKNYGGNRRSEFLSPGDDLLEEEALLEEEEVTDVHVVFTPMRTIKAVSQKNYNLSIKELNDNSTLYEVPNLSVKTQTNKDVYAFTNLGNCIKFPVSSIGICRFKDRGVSISNHYKNLEDNERIISCLVLDEKMAEEQLVFLTSSGMIKISKVSEYFSNRQVISAIRLRGDGDELLTVQLNTKKYVGMFTKDGIGVVVEKDDISCTGRVTAGVIGMKLSADDAVVSAMLIDDTDAFTLFLNNGSYKAVTFSGVPISMRNRVGSRIISKSLNKNVKIIKVGVLSPNTSYALEDSNGKLHYLISSTLKAESIDSPFKYIRNVRGIGSLTMAHDYTLS